MQYISLAVLQHADLEAKLYRYAGFSFAVPFGMWLKQGKYFFFVGDFLLLQDAPVYLLDLTLCMLDKAFYLQDEYCIYQAGILKGYG